MPRQLRAAALAGFLVLMWGTARPANAAERRDKQAVQIAHAMMEAMGGENAWTSVHFVRFDFKVISSGQVRVDRHHLWDKFTGRYRLETKTKKGPEEVVLFNVHTKEGKVYVGGKQVEGAQAAEEPEKSLRRLH